jgi:peptidyl-prolyl cis-trans isomerase C
MRSKVFYLLSIFVLLGVSVVWVSQIFSESEKILAKVGETVITQRELDELVSSHLKNSQFKQVKPFTLEDKKKLLDQMVKGALMVMEAEREKLEETPDIKAKLWRYRHELLVQAYINMKIAPSVTVSNEEIEQAIKENPNLIPKESLTLKEILVKTEKEAEEVYEELTKGRDFSEIATKKSISTTTGISGGYLKQPIVRGQLPKALEEVAFSLKKGEFSKPIKTENGYYLLYLIERREKAPEEIEKSRMMVRERIKKIEQNRKIQAGIEKRVEELKKNVKVEIFYDQLQ